MLFNSLPFILFLPLVVLAYYALAPKYRWVLLLAASYYFYMCWRVEYIGLIIASTLVDYCAARQMAIVQSKSRKRAWLIASILSNLGLLFTFKYYGFAAESASFIAEQFNLVLQFPQLELLLPVGISFYTFQTLSYSVDVYKGKQAPEKHLGYFALYVSFFPQLVAGPIERYGRLAPQLKSHFKLEYDNIANGLRLILFGFFVKMVVADNLAPLVNEVFADTESFGSLDVLGAIFAYAFQIYGDFHGYSSIAIGSALLLGINLMDNFKTPYLATGIREFWERWHISLSTWFRDYLYIPLGGNRVAIPRWAINIFLVFVISGLWHGANYTFLIWGAAYGLLYLFEHFINKFFGIKPTACKLSFKRFLLGVKTFVLVSFIWVFFRSESLDHAMQVFGALFNKQNAEAALNWPQATLFWWFSFVLLDIALFNSRFDRAIKSKPIYLRWLVYSILLFGVLAFGGVEEQPFIYFQF